MQIKLTLAIIMSLFSFSALTYECRSKELKLKNVDNKKMSFEQLRKISRQTLVEGLLFELTAPVMTKKSMAKSSVILKYLENSEVNQDQRSFFRLLAASSDLDTGKAKTLKISEVCDIMEKVNAIEGK